MVKLAQIAIILLIAHGLTVAGNVVEERAARLGVGMNLSYLDNYWLGSKDKRYVDFLKGEELAKREMMLSDIEAAGYKTVRIPVCFSAWASHDKPYRWQTEEGLRALDKMIKWAGDNGLNAIIDQHHPEMDGSVPDAANIDRVAWIWKQVAQRYKSTDPETVFFELWNEPHDIDVGIWRNHAKRLIKTVRSIAPDHTLIVGFHDWNSRKALIESKPFDDPNIIYTFHYYDPFLFTHQGASWSAEGLPDIKRIAFPYDDSAEMVIPASAKGKWSGNLFKTYRRDSSESKIMEDLLAARRWSDKHRVPIFLGEFGSYAKFADQESRCRYFKTVYTAIAETKIPSAAWEWDGGFNMFADGSNRLLPCVVEAASLSKKEKRRMTWSDEFNGVAGAPVDRSKWRFDIGGSGWGNDEFQYYTDSTKNSFHDGKGNLVIRAIEESPGLGSKCWYGECKYTSARLLTKGIFEQKYGRFEARIKVPYGQGIWPAFWMLGNDIEKVGWPECGEIDIMEHIGKEPLRAYGTVHGPGYSGANGLGTPYSLSGNKKFKDDFHVFAVEWEPGIIRWFIDGDHFKTIRSADLPKGSKWVFDHPHFLLLNLAVGGHWPGSPDETTKFPQELLIDYVRVYEKTGK